MNYLTFDGFLFSSAIKKKIKINDTCKIVKRKLDQNNNDNNDDNNEAKRQKKN